jgi:HPt (histidine-containing phosphotransfer) domain-containing protein
MLALNEVYYSNLSADPDLAELVDLFIAELPERLVQLNCALEAGNLVDLARFAHQLKGAGGSYGFPQLTPVAANLERLAKQAADEMSLRNALDELIGVTSQLRAGLPQ